MLDLTHVVSGPYGGMLLADLGVETIKIEPPGRGELTRNLLADDPAHSIDGMGAYFLSLNRNKKSVTIDLKAEAGRRLFLELVAESDIVLNNFRAGVMARLGIDYEKLAAVNPRIITCTITGFGETGPHHDQPAFDMVAQAMAGPMSITGEPAGAPHRAGIPIADLSGGMMAVIGILSAVVAREQTGRGQHVDISLLDSQISMLSYMGTMQLLSGRNPSRLGNAHVTHVPYDTYRTRDGHMMVAVITDAAWLRLANALDLNELNSKENKDRSGRARNRALIDGTLQALFLTHNSDHWVSVLRAAKVACAKVNSFAEAFDEPQVLARNMVANINHPNGTPYRAPGNPIKLSDGGPESYTPPPYLGEHTELILRELLGKRDGEIRVLRDAGVIG